MPTPLHPSDGVISSETPDRTPDPAVMLGRFVDGGRDEGAFGTLVKHLGNLVYSSALRRTGNPEMAEEVAQTVFTILARKAAVLRRHPALLAWIFKTTRFEAAKAMRAEQSRKQKHEALALQTAEQVRTPEFEDESWQELVPVLDESLDRLVEKDRQIVLQRFFEGRKFSEIAAANGLTEAASKMRLKRA